MAANMAAIKTTKPYNFWNRLADFAEIWWIYLLYDPTYVPFVELNKFKMAAIVATNMAAIKTTKPYNF